MGLFRKQIFPHDLVTGIDSLLGITTMPSRENFKAGLNSSGLISQEKYDAGVEMWELTKCRSLLDFALEYLKFDVLVSYSHYHLPFSLLLSHFHFHFHSFIVH